MSSHVRHIAQLNFFKSSNLFDQTGGIPSTLFYFLRHEWIKSFLRQSCGRYNFIWLDVQSSESIEQYNKKQTFGYSAIAWQQTTLTDKNIKSENHDCLHVRFTPGITDVTMLTLADERTRYWKKYLVRRERLESLSEKQHQFIINYRLSMDVQPYRLETIHFSNDSSLELILNIDQTLETLLADSQTKHFHPLLTPYQIAIKTNSKTREIGAYICKLLTSKYQLRVIRSNDNSMNDDVSIPFVISLNDDSIRNGLCSIWNRDTQLIEQIHVKQVAKRLADYFKALDEFV